MKDHPVYLKAWLGKRGVQFLIDTYCEQSVTPRKFIGDSRLEPAQSRLFAANGTVINVVGEVVMNVKIGELVLPRFVVSDNITESMLDVDWLRSNRMIWHFAKDILLINGKVFHLLPGAKSDSCRRVVAAEKVIVPARSQAIVPGRVEMTRMTSDVKDGHSVWTTEVSELRNGVNVARAILLERLDNLPVLVLNSSDQPCEIQADTILTELTLAPCTDENDDEILTSSDGEQSYLHQSKLLEEMDDNVSKDQRCELTGILREYADVFSKGELHLRYLSAFDLRSSYPQVPMDMKDADKTTFIVRTGTYRFRRLPFGLCNARSTFQRVMDLALHRLNFYMCLVYLDDIMVYSLTVEEHLVRLKKLFDRLRTANLKLKPSKCYLLCADSKFLGHVVSAEGVSTDPSKVKAVKDWPVPENVHEVRSFLGLAIIDVLYLPLLK